MHAHLTRSLGAAAVAGVLTALTLAGIAGAAAPVATHGPASPVTAYVLNGGFCDGGRTVTPIDTATDTALRAIKVGNGPDAIAFTPDGQMAYVVSGALPAGTCSQSARPADTVTPIRVGTGTALTPIRIKNPGAIAITPNGKTAYVVGGAGVIPISTATNKAGQVIKIRGAGVIAITPDGKTAYVTSGEYTVTPIRIATGTALRPIRVGTAPRPSRSRRTGRPPTSSMASRAR
jgi:DNA-binding beta-propeller fold protein YncE